MSIRHIGGWQLRGRVVALAAGLGGFTLLASLPADWGPSYGQTLPIIGIGTNPTAVPPIAIAANPTAIPIVAVNPSIGTPPQNTGGSLETGAPGVIGGVIRIPVLPVGNAGAAPSAAFAGAQPAAAAASGSVGIVGGLGSSALLIGAGPGAIAAMLGVHERYYEALDRGDLDGVMGMYNETADYLGLGLCRLTVCRGRGSIRAEIERQIADHLQLSRLSADASGITVNARWQATSDQLQAAGVDRVVGVDTMTLRGDQIVAYQITLDTSDSQTAVLVAWLDAGGSPAAPAPPRATDTGPMNPTTAAADEEQSSTDPDSAGL